MGNPYDFRATTAIVNIFSVDTGKVATFTAIKGSAADEHLPFFSQMTVVEDISQAGEIIINLTPPTYQDALDLLKSPWLTIGNTVSVRWGYTPDPNHLSGWHHGMLLQPDISFGDQFSISIKAQSFGWLPARQQNGQQWSGAGASPMGPLDVIEAIVKRYNFEFNYNDGIAPEPSTLDNLTVPRVINQKTNDLVFMKSLALGAGCRLFITHGNKVNLIDGARARKPSVTFVYRGQIDPANNVFPIDTFDSETTAMFLPRTAIAARFLNPNDKRTGLFRKWEANEATAKNAAISGEDVPKPDGDGPTQKAKDGQKIPRRKQLDPEKGAASYVPIVIRQKQLANRLQSQMNNIFKGKTAESHGVSATVGGVDVPTVLPEDIAAVKGVGEYHSVNYRVARVEHIVGEAFGVMTAKLQPKGFKGNLANFYKMKAPNAKDKEKPLPSPGPTSGGLAAQEAADLLEPPGSPRF